MILNFIGILGFFLGVVCTPVVISHFITGIEKTNKTTIVCWAIGYTLFVASMIY